MSPAPAAGTYGRSANILHNKRQVVRAKLARSCGAGAGPGPGPGGRSGLVGGVPGLAAAGVVWERRSGYEMAWATPGHGWLCSCSYGRGAVRPQANTSVFTAAVNLWGRIASLLAPWCA